METGFVGSQSDPGGEGFVKESMSQMGVNGGGGGGEGHEIYPERPNEANCKYYLRTGVCGYGSKCRFNHPPDRSTVVGAMRLAGGEYPQRIDQPFCKYYLMTGTCKFGLSCKYHHPSPREGDGTHVSLNYLGYPLRPGEKECAYYVKTGHCKFGVTCKFHHPSEPMDVSVTTSSPAQGIYPRPIQPPSIGVVQSNWISYPSYVQGSYAPILLHHGMLPLPGWGPFPVSPASANPATEYTGTYSVVPLSVVGPFSTGSSQKESGLPERRGETECQYYLKTGDCKYGSSCRYHHPSEVFRTNTTSELANIPISPGAQPCIYYAQYGVCKYGSACKYDHTSRVRTTLTDSPVAVYLPVESSTGTLAVASSSSSSDLHQDICAAD